MRIVLSIDAGTTGNRVIAFAEDGSVVASEYRELPQIFPHPGWVEHDPVTIWNDIRTCLLRVLDTVGREHVSAIGITNQRETTVVWDKSTGKPVYNAIVWQCRRTASTCATLKEHEESVRRKTGLFIDPYFSATKIAWILDTIPHARARAERGELAFGTIDSWILWNLTGGTVHATDVTNASRTLLYDITNLRFDDELLALFRVPRMMLPAVQESGYRFGTTAKDICGKEIPVTGILGDQQASYFAHGGRKGTIVKNTYGTGLFIVSPAGDTADGGLIRTIAYGMSGKTGYATEGSIFVGGSAVQWLRDSLGIISASEETEALARSVADNGGVYFVPALQGLGAPWWDADARGIIIGITRGTTKAHIARAALEAIAYQTADVLSEMRTQTGKSPAVLRVDGGAAKNDFLMQFQADITGMQVERPTVLETTALGAAGIAGITAGVWSEEDFDAVVKVERTFSPKMGNIEREQLLSRWKEAVKRSMKWG